MTIELFGDNCKRCQRLRNNVELALEGCNPDVKIQQIEDPQSFCDYKILSLPGLAIDGQLLTTGRLLSVQELIEIFDK